MNLSPDILAAIAETIKNYEDRLPKWQVDKDSYCPNNMPGTLTFGQLREIQAAAQKVDWDEATAAIKRVEKEIAEIENGLTVREKFISPERRNPEIGAQMQSELAMWKYIRSSLQPVAPGKDGGE